MLDLEDIEKRYADFTLGPTSLSVETEVLAILGPSGSGKSTLLGVIAGFVEPDAGRVRLNGREITHLPPEARNVGVVFQDYALFPHLSVRENLTFGADDEALIDRYVAMLDIDGLLDRAPDSLSGGEKQRVGLARALAADPDVLLLDEPLASLDEPIRRRLRLELRDLLADLEIPVVYVTHDQEEASIVADRVAVLNTGSIEQSGTVEAVYGSPQTRFVAEFVGIENCIEGTVTNQQDRTLSIDVGQITLHVALPRTDSGVNENVDPSARDADTVASDAASARDVDTVASDAASARDADSAGSEANPGDTSDSSFDSNSGRVTLAIRPESVEIRERTRDRPNDHGIVIEPNTFVGEIREVISHPPGQTIRIECPGDLELIAKADRPGPPRRDGETVLVSLPPEDIHVFQG